MGSPRVLSEQDQSSAKAAELEFQLARDAPLGAGK